MRNAKRYNQLGAQESEEDCEPRAEQPRRWQMSGRVVDEKPNQ